MHNPVSAMSPPSSFGDQKSVILVVDDNPTNLEILFQYLERAGFRVRVANSGENALEQVSRAQPDLILLDVVMSGMDGYETCRRLKAEAKTADIPVIFMTAMVDSDHKFKGFEIGAVDYVTKPYQYRELITRVTTHLTLRQLSRQLQEQQQTLNAETAARRQTEARLRQVTQKLGALLQTVSRDVQPHLAVVLALSEVLVRDSEAMPPDQLRQQLREIAANSRSAANIVAALPARIDGAEDN